MNTIDYASRMCDAVIARSPVLPLRWSYDYGVVFKGMEQVYKNTGSQQYITYIKSNMDQFIKPDGTILQYDKSLHNIDFINNGKIIIFLHQKYGEERYNKAIDTLRSQLDEQPRNADGGFWHKEIYPHQMWLDGLYMGSPFLAEYGRENNCTADMDEAANQLKIMYRNALDFKSGLLYHAYDEAREQQWADKKTGHSPNFWGRSMGWYCMALVDVMDILTSSHKDFSELGNILKNVLKAVTQVQDEATGCWYQVLGMAGKDGNYLEASCSCMFLYALAKGRRLGVLDSQLRAAEDKAHAGILKQFISEEDGLLSLLDTCEVAGLGGNPYRSGTYDYYISEPRKKNDLKGIGAFIQAFAQE